MATIALYAVKMNQIAVFDRRSQKECGRLFVRIVLLEVKGFEYQEKRVRPGRCDRNGADFHADPGAEDGVPGEDPSENRRIHG